MRDMKRNRRKIWFSIPTATIPIKDEYGNETLEVETQYLPPTLLSVNISASVGQAAVQVFGFQTEYSRTISITGVECPLLEGCRVWFGKEPNDAADDNNYVVVGVADSKNGFLVALREVTPYA